MTIRISAQNNFKCAGRRFFNKRPNAPVREKENAEQGSDENYSADVKREFPGVFVNRENVRGGDFLKIGKPENDSPSRVD